MMIMKKKEEKAERKKRKQLAKEKEAQEVRNGVQVLEVQLLWKSHGERPGTVSRYWRYSYFGKAMAVSRGRERCPGIGGTVTLEKPWREAGNGVQVLEVQLLWKSHGERPGTVSRYWRYSYFGKAMARGRERCPGIGGTVTLEKPWREAGNGVQVLEVQLLWKSHGERPGMVSRYWRYSYFGKAMARGQQQGPGIGGTVTLEKPWREAKNGVQILEVQLLWKSNGVRPGTTSRCWKYSYFGEAMARGQESCQCVEDTLLNSSMMTSAVKCVCAWWV